MPFAAMKLRGWFVERIAPPILAFILARLILVHTAFTAQQDGWSASAWSRWDSVHYLTIAKSGYEFFSCAGRPGYDPTKFCGNTAWMPGFPLLIRVLHALGIDSVVAGSFIASAFALATLIAIWNLFIGPAWSVRNALCLGLAAFFPGHVYAHALFPVSMCACFHVLALRAHATQCSVWAGVAGAAAAFSYSSGLFLAGVFGLDLLCARSPWAVTARRILVECGLVVAGFVAVMALQWEDVGVWNGFFAVQAKYGYSPTLPLTTLTPHVAALLSGQPIAPNIQTLFVFGLAVAFVWVASRAPRTPIDRTLALFFLVYWLIPLSLGGGLSLYRAEAVLMPAVPLAKKLPAPLLGVLLLAAIVISLRMGLRFFKNVLV